MQIPVLPSTFFLTLLLLVGLFFFIRASTKDRTEVARLVSDQEEALLMPALRQYFADRAYRVVAIDGERNLVTFEGEVQPSRFLATFLTGLAGLGTLCLALVLSMVLDRYGNLAYGLVLLAPLAGWFYWQRAGRLEQVAIVISPDTKTQTNASQKSDQPSTHCQITVTAHRDELIALQQSLPLRLAD